MIKVYISPSCQSCRKVVKWFKEQNIPFVQRNIFSAALDEAELKDILAKSENGTDDIISSRSKIIKEQGIDLDDMKISEMIAFIKEHPSVLKRPIILDDRRMQVGYNEEEIRMFIPRARKIAELACSPKECPQYATCEHVKDLKGSD